MAVDKRVVAGGAGVAALLGLIAYASAGEPEAPKKAPPKPTPPLTGKQRAIALAVKYARIFGVPSSLILGLMAVGGWKERGQVANSRGGAWGYTFMTLATAKDLTQRFPALAKQYWPRFNGTAQSLLDPETNIALGAYQLALQWRKFKRWSVASLSYYTGAGRMATLVKATGGKLPATLPTDVAKMRAAWLRVRTADPTVALAIKQDGASATGAPVFATSEDAKQKWNTLNAATTNLDGDISRWYKSKGKHTADEDGFVNAWLTWRNAVYSEYKDNARFKIIPDLAWSVWNRGDEKIRELAEWRLRYEGISGKKASAPTTTPEEAGKPKTDYGPLIKGGIVVAGIAAAAALVSSVKH